MSPMRKTAKAANTSAKNTQNKTGGALEVDPSFAPIVAAFANDPQVTCGKMMASVGLKVNGKIFVMMVKGKLVAKLPKPRVDDLVRSGKGEYFDPGHGRLMKEWVALAGSEPSWIELAREAYRFVNPAR